MIKKKILIVDDSVVIRTFLKELFDSDSELEVIGAASDPYKARTIMKENWPDIITLDVEMPKMNGIEFLKKIMKSRPTPVIMLSTLTKKGAGITLEALEIGAIDYISKPDGASWDDLNKTKVEILQKVKNASMSNLKRKSLFSTDKSIIRSTIPSTSLSKKLVLIGSSTGGVQTLTNIFSRLPKNIPGIVVVQHMPKSFLESLALQLDKKLELDVKIADNNTPITAGTILIAPGDVHTVIIKKSGLYYTKLIEGNPVGYHRPAVNILFQSASKIASTNILGVILTGMGDDGAKGMAMMRENGCRTLGQDKNSSIVYGMPKRAFELGGVEKQFSLSDIPKKVIEFSEGNY